MNTRKNKDVSASAPQGEAAASQEAKRLPVKQFRLDDVTASIFERRFKERTYHSVSFTRSYKDATGSWKYTKNFDVEDLGRLVAAAQQAAEWIHGLAYPERMPED